MRCFANLFVVLLALTGLSPAAVQVGVEELLAFDQMPPRSTERKIKIHSLRNSAGDDFIELAVDEFSAGRISHDTMLELLESLGHHLPKEAFRQVLDASWKEANVTGNFRKFYRLAEAYGEAEDLKRVFASLDADFNAHGLDAVWALGTSADIEKASKINDTLVAQGNVDPTVFEAFRQRIEKQVETGSERLVRRQRQALLSMSPGERNLYFAFRASVQPGQSWDTLFDALRSNGSEAALKLLSRDILPRYIEKFFADAIEQVFPDDDLVEQLKEKRSDTASLSAQAQKVVGPATKSKNNEIEKSNENADAGESEKTTSLPIWAVVIAALVFLSIVVVLVRARKSNSPR